MKAVISVPFELAARMFEAHQKGVEMEVVAIIGGCTLDCAKAIINHQARLHARKKYKTEAEPA